MCFAAGVPWLHQGDAEICTKRWKCEGDKKVVLQQGSDMLGVIVKINSSQHGAGTLTLQMQHQMRLFRAQRNFYIVGFTLFLCLVIRRLLGLISSNDTLQVQKTWWNIDGPSIVFFKILFLQLESDALVAAGRDTDKIINEDALQNADQDACKNLQKRIANAKSVTKSANLTSESLQEKCTNLQREIQRYLSNHPIDSKDM